MPLTRPDRYLPHQPAAHVALRSPAVSALAVDFTGAPIGTLAARIALTSAGGRVDGIAQWLRLDFGDGVVYENTPFTTALAHWMVPVTAFAAPRETAPGEVIEAQVRVFGQKLIVSAG